MSVVFGNNPGYSNMVRWIFDKFIQRSNVAFESFVNKGSACTPMQCGISYTMDDKDDKPVVTTAPDNYMMIVNYYSTSFRNVLPNMSGEMLATSQSYGLVMLCMLSGIHNVALKQIENTSQSISVVIHLMMSGSTDSALQSVEAAENLKKANILFLHEKLHLLYLALTFEQQIYEHKSFDKNHQRLGLNVVDLDFIRMITGEKTST